MVCFIGLCIAMKQRPVNFFKQETRLELWDERLAHSLALILALSPLTPNMITTLSLILVIISGLLFATGLQSCLNIAALCFMLVRFLDHLDGELARAKQKESLVGYYYDWFTDTFSYSILFISLAIGFHDMLSDMLNILVIFAVSACLFNTALSLLGEHHDNKELYKGFPSYAGFSIDDGMYMIGPICWMGYLYPFFIICLVGAVVFTLVRFSVLLLKQSRIDCNKTIDN